MAQYDFRFYHWEKETPDAPFLRQPFGDKWEVYTWKEAGQMIRKLATGLQSLGLPPKSHIGLVSKNCREWIIAEIAISMAGYISVPFYPTLKAKSVKELIEIGDVKALFAGKLADWEGMKAGVPIDMPLIRFPHYKDCSEIKEGYDWFDFINKFEPLKGEPRPDLEDVWTIIFTSGTTGTPKGVVMPYSVLNNVREVTKADNNLKFSFEGDNHFFSYLPLNHIAERLVVGNAVTVHGGVISFTESLATFFKNLQEVQPTLFFAVPRIWTKFQMGVLAKMPQEKLDAALASPNAAAVKKQLLQSLGLGNVRGCVTGAAPMTEELKDWYRKLDVPIAESYGMTETSGVATTLVSEYRRPGSVGTARAGVKIKIDAATGEILIASPYLMRGYYKEPVKTAETLKDGWMHTGDEGRLDDEGFLYITGRIKDTFKTTKGQFIAPAPIESHFGQETNIEQLCIMGLGCPQPIALVVLSEIGLALPTAGVKESLENTLKEVNRELPNYQKVSTIVVVKDIWSIENGLLTPTLKVKRNVMGQRYKNLLMAWHEDKEAVVFESEKMV